MGIAGRAQDASPFTNNAALLTCSGRRVPFEWYHVITLSVAESMALRSACTAWSQGREIAGCAVLRADTGLTYFCGKPSRNRCTANCSCRVAVLRRKKMLRIANLTPSIAPYESSLLRAALPRQKKLIKKIHLDENDVISGRRSRP